MNLIPELSVSLEDIQEVANTEYDTTLPEDILEAVVTDLCKTYDWSLGISYGDVVDAIGEYL